MKLTFETKDGKIVPVCDPGEHWCDSSAMDFNIKDVQKCTVTSGEEVTFMTVTVKVENADAAGGLGNE